MITTINERFSVTSVDQYTDLKSEAKEAIDKWNVFINEWGAKSEDKKERRVFSGISISVVELQLHLMKLVYYQELELTPTEGGSFVVNAEFQIKSEHAAQDLELKLKRYKALEHFF